MDAPSDPAPLADAAGEHRFAAFGPDSEIGAPATSIVNPRAIHVGTFVKIGKHAVIEALVPERGIGVRISDGAYIGHFCRITAVGEVVIGEEAMLIQSVPSAVESLRCAVPSGR